VNNVSLVSLLGTGPCQEAGARPPGPGARASPRAGPPAAPHRSAPFHVPHGPKLMFDKDKEDGKTASQTKLESLTVRFGTV
jgi:hypothetical protein